MKLLLKFKNFFTANSEPPIKNHRIKVALNLLYRIFLNFAEVSSCPSDYFPEIKNGGH